ncbi:hypothetical protein [Cellulomonas hominis]
MGTMTSRAPRLDESLPDEPVSSLFASDVNVLGMLPGGAPSDAPPVLFGASRWDLMAVNTWPDYQRSNPLRWDRIANPRWRVAAKESAVLLMCPGIALEHHLHRARRSPYPPWALGYQRMSYWARWFNYLTDENITSLRLVTQDVCNAFLATITPDCRHIAISALRVFSDYGSLLTHDKYAPEFRPWGTQSAASASGVPQLGKASNKTPPIPDRVFAPLLAACLHIVEHLGPDVLAATAQLDRLTSIPPTPRGAAPIPSFDARLDDYLSALRGARRLFPGLRGSDGQLKPNLQTVALHLGLRDAKVLRQPRRWAKIQGAVDDLGLGVGGLYGLRPDVEFDRWGLTRARLVVQIACTIVVAALSGMRHSELGAIAPGAYRREDLPSGQVRYRINSKLLKGEPPGGRREVWTVIEPVVSALMLAEQLNPGQRPVRLSEFQDMYGYLREWVETHGEREGLQPIPGDWTIEPRQFRRTLARELAWRPGGVIAGKIHLKHVSVATTEGYAGARGESASAFIAEIEAERRARNQKTTADVIAAVERGEPVAGLGAKALVTAVSDLSGDASARGVQVRDRDDALKPLIRSRADTLHVTPLAYCWFVHPDQARCLRDSKDKSRPLVGSCRPDLCANATVHPEHAPIWLNGLDALRKTIADRRVPAGERERLTTKAADIQAMIDAIGGDRR